MLRSLVVITLLSVSLTAQVPSQDQHGTVVGHIAQPKKIPFTGNILQRLKAPPGFQVSVWAKDLQNPRMIAVNEDTIYITRPQQNDVIMLKDQNGRAGVPSKVAELEKVHGIALRDGKAYLATVHDVWLANIKPDGSLDPAQKIITGIGDGGQHDKRTIAFGPDGKLYLSVGSTCNACDDPLDKHALIYRADPDGKNVEVFAQGLRNTIGFDWHPETREMWGVDNGVDWRGDNSPPEELNKLEKGGNYGWPYCYGARQPDRDYDHDPKGKSKEEYCAQTMAPVLLHTAHAAPIWFLFYNAAQFPAQYKGDAFVAFHGSWNRMPASGYDVERIKYDHGKPIKFEPFLTGFLAADQSTQFGRPAGLAVMKDGSLLVSDDTNGVIYRVSYRK